MTMIVSIVEGHGEVKTVPLLVRRIAAEMAIPVYAPRAMRLPKGKMKNELPRMLALARAEVKQAEQNGGVLIVLDADDDCPAKLGVELRSKAQAAFADLPVVVGVANKEFEAWYLAAAVSLRGQRGLPNNLEPPLHPETIRNAKGWLAARMAQGYTETLDQEALAAKMDFTQAEIAPSFRRFRQRVSDLIVHLNSTQN
jgi:hypothetical protein